VGFAPAGICADRDRLLLVSGPFGKWCKSLHDGQSGITMEGRDNGIHAGGVMDSTSDQQPRHRDVFVLSGGAARGAVQVGMLEVLLDAGIVPDALVGTSVGALNAVFMGFRPDRDQARELRRKWLALSTQDIFPGGTLTRVGHLLRQRPYLFSNASLHRLIDDWLVLDRLEDLPTPVRVVTTPLAGDGAVYHRHGALRQLLLASAAVPGVFAPIHLPDSCGVGGPHVDGGVADLVPVRGAADLAPTRVFVLDATVPARLPRGRTPIDVLVASMGVAMRANPVPDLGVVELHHMRTPDRGTGMTDFTHTAQHIADGREAAAAVVALLADSGPPDLVQPSAVRRASWRWDRRHRAA
jgi:NTE family protein